MSQNIFTFFLLFPLVFLFFYRKIKQGIAARSFSVQMLRKRYELNAEVSKLTVISSKRYNKFSEIFTGKMVAERALEYVILNNASKKRKKEKQYWGKNGRDFLDKFLRKSLITA